MLHKFSHSKSNHSKSNQFAKYHRTRQGITLIELLVAIGIISILAAILFPVVAKLRYNSSVTYAKEHGLPPPIDQYKTDIVITKDSKNSDDKSSDAPSYQTGYTDGYGKGHSEGFSEGLKAGQGIH